MTDESSPRVVEHPSPGVAAIAAERAAQVSREGWTPEHDDEHTAGQMAAAAACYAYRVVQQADPDSDAGSAPPPPLAWPWHDSWWKPRDPRRNLVRAGALIAAEIDRLDRASGVPSNERVPNPPSGCAGMERTDLPDRLREAVTALDEPFHRETIAALLEEAAGAIEHRREGINSLRVIWWDQEERTVGLSMKFANGGWSKWLVPDDLGLASAPVVPRHGIAPRLVAPEKCQACGVPKGNDHAIGCYTGQLERELADERRAHDASNALASAANEVWLARINRRDTDIFELGKKLQALEASAPKKEMIPGTLTIRLGVILDAAIAHYSRHGERAPETWINARAEFQKWLDESPESHAPKENIHE